MFTSKVMFIVAIAIEATLLVSSITFTKPVIAKKDSGGSSGSSSSKSDYDKFQKCLSDGVTGGSATKQQIWDCFDSTYGGGSSNSGSTGHSDSGSHISSSRDNNNNNNNQ